MNSLLFILIMSTFSINSNSIREISATQVDGQLNLSWTVDINEDAEYAKIWRSLYMDNYEVIGRVKLDSNTPNYSFVDKAPYLGESHYRIDIIDKDGNKKYSAPITIEVRNDKEVEIQTGSKWKGR